MNRPPSQMFKRQAKLIHKRNIKIYFKYMFIFIYLKLESKHSSILLVGVQIGKSNLAIGIKICTLWSTIYNNSILSKANNQRCMQRNLWKIFIIVLFILMKNWNDWYFHKILFLLNYYVAINNHILINWE